VFNYLKNANYLQDDKEVSYYELYDLQVDPNELKIYMENRVRKRLPKD